MACVNFANDFGFASRLALSAVIARKIRSTRSGMPITPVEQTRICVARQPIARAAAVAVCREAASPALPVAQFAFPEFTITARIREAERRMCSCETSTGAAFTQFVVNTQAAVAGASLTRKPTSNPDFFNPQAVAEKVKARGKLAAEKAGIFKLENLPLRLRSAAKLFPPPLWQSPL